MDAGSSVKQYFPDNGRESSLVARGLLYLLADRATEGKEGDSGDEVAVESSVLTEVLGIAILVVNVLFAFTLKRLEPWAEKKHPYIGMTLRVLYKELMSLGFVSLSFTLVEIYVHPNKKVIQAFEFAHIFLFVLAVMNVFVVGVVTYTSLRISRRWKRFQLLQTTTYERDKQEFEDLMHQKNKHANFIWQQLLWSRGAVKRNLRFQYLHEEMNFHDLRIQFLAHEKLPLQFNFSKYMRHIKSNIFVELVEVKWTTWLAVLAVFLLDCIRRIFYRSYVYDILLITAFSGANTALVFLIYAKIRIIYWELTKHPGLYFGSENRGELDNLEEDELMILQSAEENAREQQVKVQSTGLVGPHGKENGDGPENDSLSDSLLKDNVSLPDVPLRQSGPLRDSGALKHSGPLKDSGSLRETDLDNRNSLRTSKASVEGVPLPVSRKSLSRVDEDPFAKKRNEKEFVDSLYSKDPVRGSRASSDMGSRRSGSNAAEAEMDLMASTRRAIVLSKKTPSDRSAVSTVVSVTSPIGDDKRVRRSPTSDTYESEYESNVSLPVNKTIQERAAEIEHARAVETAYPVWLTSLIPRLKRRASPAEKLFWFGSSHFFSWLGQMILFTSVILLSLVVTDAMFPTGKPESVRLYILMVITTVVSAVIVWITLAFTMKKYIVVLNAAHLVDEELSRVLIEESLRDTLVEDFDEDSSDEENETEADRKAKQRSRFFFLGWLRSRQYR